MPAPLTLDESLVRQASTARVELFQPRNAPYFLISIELKNMPSSSIEIAVVLRRLAEMLEMGHSATVRLADQTILVPAKADVSCKYQSATDTNEINIRVTWGLVSSTAPLIRLHSERVQDTLGNLYEVLVYGEPRLDGTWEGWLEFVPISAGLSSLRTERETTQPDLSALEYWATGLEPMYLAGAFQRAQSGTRAL
jgi:hypothetical protein